jgi:hypothetical protein
MPYIEQTIKSGDLLEVNRYFSPKGNKGERAASENVSSDKQQAANDKEAERWLVRKLNTNFSRINNDLFATFTYSEDVDEKTARREIKNCIRRLRRYFHRNGMPELRYAETTEKQGRWHHHLIISYVPLDVLTEIWGKGRVSVSILDPTNNYEDLAAYLAKHEKPPKGEPDGDNTKEPRRKHARRWTFSKNLKNPIVEEKPITRDSIMKKPPTAPKGYYLLPDWKIGCDAWGNLYQRFKCLKINPPPKATKPKRRKKA